MRKNLETAIREKNYIAIAGHIENGVDLNKPLESNNLPLWIATEKMEMDIVEFLIDAGANPERSILGGPNTYDVIAMRNETRMGCPSDWALSYINKIKNYYNKRKASSPGR